MALSDTNKLNKFAAEAYSEADRVCSEIKAVMDKERREKLESGRKKLLEEIREMVLSEKERLRKENSLSVSRKNTELRQEYLLKLESTLGIVTDGVRAKLNEFALSDEYGEYLKKIAAKILEVYPKDLIIHHAERDANLVIGLKGALASMNYDISSIDFEADPGIRIGGLKFHPKGRNIQINETLDEKLYRSADTLNELISQNLIRANK